MLRGLYGVAGVPPMLFALITNVSKDEFRASVSFGMMFSELVAVIELLFIENNFKESDWIEYLTILICGFIGLGVGNVISPYLSQEQFHIFVMYLIFSGGIILVSQNGNKDDELTKIDFYMSLSLMAVGVIMIVYWFLNNFANKNSNNNCFRSSVGYDTVDELETQQETNTSDNLKQSNFGNAGMQL